MSISYNDNIPAAPNNPSNDQPLMQENTTSLSDIWDIDHITFKSGAGLNSGQHRQVNFNKTAVSDNVPGAQTGVNSALYTDAGVAEPTKPQLYWRNIDDIFPISAVKAFVKFTSANSNPISIGTSFNITSVTAPVAGTILVTLDTTSVIGTGVCVLTSYSTNSGLITYTFANPASNPTLTFTNMAPGLAVSVAFLQI